VRRVYRRHPNSGSEADAPATGWAVRVGRIGPSARICGSRGAVLCIEERDATRVDRGATVRGRYATPEADTAVGRHTTARDEWLASRRIATPVAIFLAMGNSRWFSFV
jgi:hypothetical protein